MTDIVEWLRKEAELVALDRLSEAADEIERLQRDSAELDRLTIQWNAARTERLAEIGRGDDKRWGKALTAALAEIARLKAERNTTKRMLEDVLARHGLPRP